MLTRRLLIPRGYCKVFVLSVTRHASPVHRQSTLIYSSLIQQLGARRQTAAGEDFEKL